MRIALLLLPLALASLPPNHPAYRRHHAKLIARQNGTDTDTPAVSSTPSSSSVAPTSSEPPTSSAPPTSSSSSSAAAASSSSATPSSSDTPTPTTAADTSSADTSSAVSSSAVTSDTPNTSSATSSAAAVTETLASNTNTDTDTFSFPSNSRSAVSRTVVKTQTAKPSGSSAAAKEEEEESGGLPKGALIAIIVCSVILGVGGIAWTLFRKWKLKPSKGFDQRMQPIDFSPNNNDMGDDFFEKTMARDADAERQRQQFCIELDNDAQKDGTLVGDLQHDFTAGSAQGGYGYQPSPYGAAGYDFSSPRNDWDAGATGYPPQPGAAYYNEYPTQDAPDQHSALGHGNYADHSQHGHATGYADLQRGPSVGHAPAPLDFGSDFAVSGRPTDASAGPASPYAQAATFRH